MARNLKTGQHTVEQACYPLLLPVGFVELLWVEEDPGGAQPQFAGRAARFVDRDLPRNLQGADRALAARTAFFAEHDYPLPVEGFAVRSGAPGRALQVVFPADWSSFHATDSFYAFVQGLGEAEQEDYAGRKAALMETMSSAEYHDGSFAAELSYRP